MSYYTKCLIRNSKRIKSATFQCVDRLDYYKQVTSLYRKLSFACNPSFRDWSMLFVIKYACISYTHVHGLHVDRCKIEFDFVETPLEVQYE